MSKFKKATTPEEAFKIETKPEKGEPYGWVQWKGTDVCMDVNCTCGYLSHIDGDFVYEVVCPNCKKCWHCNGHIEFVELTSTPETAKIADL